MLTFPAVLRCMDRIIFSRMRNLTRDGQQEGSSPFTLFLFIWLIAFVWYVFGDIHYIINVFSSVILRSEKALPFSKNKFI